MRQKTEQIVFNFIITSLILILLSGCNGSFFDNYEDKDETENKVETFLTLTFRSSSDNFLRSNPNGGESGDGDETGSINENEINEVTVFFYKGSSITSSLNEKIEKSIYISSDQIISNKTTVQKISLNKGVYRIIVVANAGDISHLFYGKTIGDLANMIIENAWSTTTPAIDFTMTSCNDDVIDLSIATSEISPAEVEVELERVAAKIEFTPSNTTGEAINNYLTNTGSRVIINSIKLVNILSGGSYILKRTATDINGTTNFFILGDETPVSGVQTNYVLDPWSHLKTKSNISNSVFPLNGSNTSYFSIYNNLFEENLEFLPADAIKTAAYTLGYTFENTFHKDEQINAYSTGIVLQTTFIPNIIKTYNTSTRIIEDTPNSNAKTFFSTYGSSIFYSSLEAYSYNSLKSNQPSNDFFSQVFTTANTWQDLQNYLDRMHDNDITGFRSYLINLLAGKTMTANLSDNISWAEYMLETFGYSNNLGTITINQNSKNTARLLSSRGIRCYENGKAYYHYWIRHSNNNDATGDIMEFGIVRNNIYKLKVQSFSGPGKPFPYDPATDNPENKNEESDVSLKISIKPWKLIEHPEIIL